MGRLLHGLLGLVATLQVLVAQAPRVPALQVKGGLLQGGVRQVGPGNNIILQAHPGADDSDLVGETTTPTVLWNPATGAGAGGLEVETGASPPPPPQEEDMSPHSAATLGAGGGVGSEQLASRMVTSGSGGTEEAGGEVGGGAGSRTSHDEHRNVTTPNAPRRRPGRSPGAPPALQGADGGSSTPAIPSPMPLQDGAMAAQSAPNQYNSNTPGRTTALSTPPPPPEDTLRPAQHVSAMPPPPEVNVHDVPTVDLAVSVDTSRSSSSEDEDKRKDDSMIVPEPTLAPSITKHYYTFPPALRPNLAYLGFIIYDTTPGYHGNTDRAHRLQGRDTTVWIAILSVACFLAGFMITTIVCYALYRRKWRPAPGQHQEDDLPPSDDLDDLLYSSDTILTDDPDAGGVGSGSSSGVARSSSTEQLLPVVAGSTDLELLTCSQTNLLQCDFLNDLHVHDNSRPGGGQITLHRHPPAEDRQQQEEGAGDEELSSQRRSSRGGSTSTCSRSSCSTCSTVLTLDSPGLAEEGGVRRSSNGSATTGDSPGGVSWGNTSSHGSVSTDNGYFTPGGSIVDWTSET